MFLFIDSVLKKMSEHEMGNFIEHITIELFILYLTYLNFSGYKYVLKFYSVYLTIYLMVLLYLLAM